MAISTAVSEILVPICISVDDAGNLLTLFAVIRQLVFQQKWWFIIVEIQMHKSIVKMYRFCIILRKIFYLKIYLPIWLVISFFFFFFSICIRIYDICIDLYYILVLNIVTLYIDWKLQTKNPLHFLFSLFLFLLSHERILITLFLRDTNQNFYSVSNFDEFPFCI